MCGRSPGHSDVVWGVAVSPDGRRAVSASSDSTLKVWNLESGAIIAAFTADARVFCGTWAGDRNIVAGDELGRVHFLELVE
jgi:WD40 repeat protein